MKRKDWEKAIALVDKEAFLSQFRTVLKGMLAEKTQGSTEKLKTINMKELAEEYVHNPLISKAFKAFGVEAVDIEKVLVECRDELLEGVI